MAAMSQPTDEDFEQVLDLLQQPETPERSLNMACAMTGELLSFSPIPIAAAASTSTGAGEPMELDGVSLENCDYLSLHNFYEQLLRSGKESQSRLDAVKELLCAHREDAASIPERAASEYGSSVLQGNNNDFEDIYYMEQLSQPFSRRQTSYEETSQDTWIERKRFLQGRDLEMLEQSIREGREGINHTIRKVSDRLTDECNKILSSIESTSETSPLSFSFSVESPRWGSYENYEESVPALAATSALLEAAAASPLGAPGGRKRNHDLGMDASDQSSTNGMLPRPTELSSSDVSLIGKYNSKTATFTGKWALSLDTLHDNQVLTHPFQLSIRDADTSNSTDVPQSGTYKGPFRFPNFTASGAEEMDFLDHVQFDFTENSEGYYNVGGSGANDFGTYSVSGIFKDGQLTINRIFHREQELKFRRRHTVLKSGARVLVRWGDNECYEGTVLSYDGGSREHLIKYDLDGEEIPENLARHGYCLLDEDGDDDESFVMADDDDDDDESLVVEEADDDDKSFVMAEEEEEDEEPQQKRRRKETGRKKSANAGATSSAALPSSRPVKILPTAIMNDGGTDTEVKVKITIGHQLVYNDHPTTTTTTTKSRRSFAQSAAAFKAFKESNPDLTDVPKTYHDKALYNWQQNTRTRYWGSDPKRTPLSKDEIDALDDAGFDYGRGPNRTFAQSAAAFKAFKESNPDLTSVPETYHDKALYKWQQNTRLRYWGSDPKRTPLSKDEMDALDDAGFDYGRGPNRTFAQNVAALIGFKAKFGHTRVPKSFEDRVLANFVRNVRSRYWDGSLSHEATEKLESLEFEWEILDAQWQNMYQKLVVFQKEHGHTQVPITYDLQLHRWTYRQRQLANLVDTHDSSRLKKWKRELLDDIGFDYYINIRSRSVKELRIEWKWMHECEQRVLQPLGLEFFSLDQTIGELNKRPDGTIEIDSSFLILEVDERSHNPPTYTPEKEQSRMKAIRDEARRLGYNNVVIIRVNTGNYTEVLPQQLQTVREVFEKILSQEPEANAKRYDVYYVDYDDNHVHVRESEKADAGFDRVEKFHTAKFDPQAYTVKESDLVE